MPHVDTWSRRFALGLGIAALASGWGTYSVLTGRPPFGKGHDAILWLLNSDLIILSLLVILIAGRIIRRWTGRRQGLAGSRLHTRLFLIFSFLATAPAILMTIFATMFLHIGVQSWFSDRVRTAVTESQAIAEAYLHEHMQVIRADTLAMANDLDHVSSLFLTEPADFAHIVQQQSELRDLPDVAIFNANGTVLAHVGPNALLEMASIPSNAIVQANAGDVAVITKAHDDHVRAVVRLGNFPNSYLFVERTVDPKVISHVTDTRAAVKEYQRLEAQQSRLQIKIALIFIAVALLLLLSAIWFSLIFSRQLILPIIALIAAADRIREGDMTVRVPIRGRHDEFDVLARAFNRMTREVESRRNEAIGANRQLDERRRFIEAVLAGASSGIIGIDNGGRITLANATANALFGVAEEPLTGYNILDILPSLRLVLAQAHARPQRVAQAQIPFASRTEDAQKTLLVRIAVERIGAEEMGAVLTFDDITELQSAQRKAAWSDVARRIAHEIKNPLTPIQLSAERLKRKYLRQITEEPEIFANCTDTIIEHVGDIGRMVDEFSAFARMPDPVIKTGDLGRLVSDIVAFEQQAHPGITFALKIPAAGSVLPFDNRQMRQAVTNIVQNAVESIEGANTADGAIDVHLVARPISGDVAIVVTDNGPGLPRGADPMQLAEPYVTHKEKGTGLGLAIVTKIMEDHHGRLQLGAPDWLRGVEGWRNLPGATVLLLLPAIASAEDNDARPDSDARYKRA